MVRTGATTLCGCGASDRLPTITDPEGGTASIACDVRERVPAVTESGGARDRCEPDAAGRTPRRRNRGESDLNFRYG